MRDQRSRGVWGRCSISCPLLGPWSCHRHPSPTLKAMVKPMVKPPQWVYAAPPLRTPGWSAGQNFVMPFAKPTAGLPTPQVVSVKVTAPERKELPLIDGQVPRDAGVEGMHPVDFKAFWEQNLFTIFKFLSTCSDLPVGVLGSKRFSHVDLLMGSSGFPVFRCHMLPQHCAFFGFLWCVQA